MTKPVRTQPERDLEGRIALVTGQTLVVDGGSSLPVADYAVEGSSDSHAGSVRE
jgi:hypothetical protein